MKKILFLVIFLPFSIYSQDQDFIESILTEGQKVNNSLGLEEKAHFQSSGKSYFLDLLFRDGLEKIIIDKSDGKDIFNVYTAQHDPLYKVTLDPLGPYSRIYKILYKDISKEEKLLVLYHFEGVNKYLNLKSSSRLYFITWNPRREKSFHTFKGPVIWNELVDGRDYYFQKKRLLQVFDLDQNGYRDVIVKYGRTSLSYAYYGNGVWKQP